MFHQLCTSTSNGSGGDHSFLENNIRMVYLYCVVTASLLALQIRDFEMCVAAVVDTLIEIFEFAMCRCRKWFFQGYYFILEPLPVLCLAWHAALRLCGSTAKWTQHLLWEPIFHLWEPIFHNTWNWTCFCAPTQYHHWYATIGSEVYQAWFLVALHKFVAITVFWVVQLHRRTTGRQNKDVGITSRITVGEYVYPLSLRSVGGPTSLTNGVLKADIALASSSQLYSCLVILLRLKRYCRREKRESRNHSLCHVRHSWSIAHRLANASALWGRQRKGVNVLPFE